MNASLRSVLFTIILLASGSDTVAFAADSPAATASSFRYQGAAPMLRGISAYKTNAGKTVYFGSEMIITVHEVTRIGALADHYAPRSIEALSPVMYLMTFDNAQDPLALLDALENDPNIRTVQPNFRAGCAPR